ncbi:peptidoglycan-binding protein [Pedobacter alpinus]|uniref:Peptidoglycan-binding protein n=1 Tax=Pedobacter alpinus TaxID=1590643 RepID=A0ABW5TQS2_9SPHI
MATIRNLLGILCLIALGSYRLPHRHLLNAAEQEREKLVNIARKEIGVREQSGQNDGERVETYLKAVNLQRGQPWCAAFVSWTFMKAGYARPRTAWSPFLFVERVKTKSIKPGNILGIWFPNLKRIAHVGLVEKQAGDWIISIEGNTNIAGSREGDGVYRKRRLAKSIYAYADWIKLTEGEKKP